MKSDCDAFAEDPELEIARILMEAATAVKYTGDTSRVIRDINGNTCGKWELKI